MLTEEEVNQYVENSLSLKEKSPELYEKIFYIIQSPYLSVYLALKIQLLAYATELEVQPFTIRGNDNLDKFIDMEEPEKIMEALASVARQRAETSLKIAKEMKDLAYDVEEVGKKLTQRESKEAVIKVTGRAEELRNKMLLEKNGQKK